MRVSPLFFASLSTVPVSAWRFKDIIQISEALISRVPDLGIALFSIINQKNRFHFVFVFVTGHHMFTDGIPSHAGERTKWALKLRHRKSFLYTYIHTVRITRCATEGKILIYVDLFR